ncbi:CobQ-like glutamine amidotransferase family enzyme [Agromyces sp. 3263]|uniref:type 1 glutamine amidotransferase n=1 Tax=Agromyces sp. 3263 TaxID=2817750 RepID=UPI0028668E85|nr:cobyric acid synthase [Agromyces sp. 3263]MDR6907207.1 CobQ-like glutamine amidotransferase family enzyme [Agromyces sp. 3263]
MTTLNIVSLLPSLMNTNGDAENATVLQRRAEWAGLEACVIAVDSPADLPGRVDAVVIGSGSDASLEAVRSKLLTIHDELRTWGTDGIPILSVGTGWELLSWGIERRDGSTVEGLGILPGRAVPRDGRATGDVVVASPRFGLLVGFENHARDYVGAEGSPLGRLRSGTGNGRGSGQEGVVMGAVIGTHLHGPVLAKNPEFADHLLASMAERAGLEYVAGPAAAVADAYAAVARETQLAAVGAAASVTEA